MFLSQTLWIASAREIEMLIQLFEHRDAPGGICRIWRRFPFRDSFPSLSPPSYFYELAGVRSNFSFGNISISLCSKAAPCPPSPSNQGVTVVDVRVATRTRYRFAASHYKAPEPQHLLSQVNNDYWWLSSCQGCTRTANLISALSRSNFCSTPGAHVLSA